MKGNAQVAETCLICNASGQDGYDNCLLGLRLRSGGAKGMSSPATVATG